MDDSLPHDRSRNTPRSSGDVQDRSLLAVFAHPDDESIASGGLLAWCASLGARVTLVCATRGEHGPGHERMDLGAVREAELRAAAAVLGITEVILLDHEDGMLPWVEENRLEVDIHNAIARVDPDIVITFGADGLYWHPDHIAVHEATTRAVSTFGAEPPALYYASIPPGSMQAVVDHAVEVTGDRSQPQEILGVTDVTVFGSMAAPATLILDTGDYSTKKLAALKCHVTQVEHSALAHITERDAPRLLGLEHYQRADIGAHGVTFIERL